MANEYSEDFVEHISGTIKIQKITSQAEFPYKERSSDIGYDITLIGRNDNIDEDTVGKVTLFKTGLKIKPPEGYYCEIIARSSLYKHGYILVNSVGIIDPGYTGELMVALYKFEDCDDIELPFRAVQLVLRKAEYAFLESCKEIEETNRGPGGFGSTGFGPPSPRKNRRRRRRNGKYNDDYEEKFQTPKKNGRNYMY